MLTLVSLCQIKNIKVLDSIASRIDSISHEKATKYSVDTFYDTEYGKVQLKGEFEAYLNPSNNQFAKITINKTGRYFENVTFYFLDGKAFKSQIHKNFQRTDTNPEVELNTITYFDNESEFHSVELIPSTYKVNSTWYLIYINDLVKFSGISF